MRLLLIALFALSFAACAKQRPKAQLPPQRSGPPPELVKHLPPDASHLELAAAVQTVFPNPEERSATLAEMASASKRLFAWQAAINAQRPEEQRVRFDRDMKGIPIETPFEYNGDTVIQEFHDAIDALNPEMRAVVTGASAAVPSSTSTPNQEFETRARKVLAAYDHAMRWEALSPYLDYYKTRDIADVRGYYFLRKVDGLEDKLTHWKDRAPDEARRMAGWLIGTCRNGGIPLADCTRDLQAQEAAGNVLPFFQSHLDAAHALWTWYFSLVQPRTDVVWHEDEHGYGPIVPFTRPAKDDTARLAKTLIEAAWKGEGWQLSLDYTDRSDGNTPHLVFQAGALPHVNRIAGSEITMDENIPADNEMVPMVFQHEFGHVIGFPDCYVELYDEGEQKMINYQLDVTNIMCSRLGKVSDLHRDAIRAAYGKPAAPRQPSSKKRRTR